MPCMSKAKRPGSSLPPGVVRTATLYPGVQEYKGRLILKEPYGSRSVWVTFDPFVRRRQTHKTLVAAKARIRELIEAENYKATFGKLPNKEQERVRTLGTKGVPAPPPGPYAWEPS